MRKMQVMLLALVAVFAFSVVAASGASALEWLLNGKPLAEPTTVDSKDVGKIKLTDMKGGVFNEEVTVECEEVDKGTVGAGAADTETEVVATECVTSKGTCASKPTFKMLNLPWKTSLSGTMTDTLETSAGKEPGYEINCSLGVKDTCTAESNVGLLVENLATDVDLVFTLAEAEAKPTKCTRGGEKQGLVVGRVLVLDPEGSLSVS